jgi:hypothetical protein
MTDTSGAVVDVGAFAAFGFVAGTGKRCAEAGPAAAPKTKHEKTTALRRKDEMGARVITTAPSWREVN